MYEIVRSPFGNTHLLKLWNPDTGEFVQILPEIGAALHQVCLACGPTLYPLLWSLDDAEQFFGEGLVQYRGELLMPFVDRIENGKYSFEGVEYVLPRNDPDTKNALHGFMNQKAFQEITMLCDENRASVFLSCTYEGNHSGYPFPFVIKVSYHLSSKGFHCKTQVQNTTLGNIPVGMGWHPYFKLKENPSDYAIKIPAIASFYTREDYINTGERRPFNKENQFLPLTDFSFNVFELRGEKEEEKTILRNHSDAMDVVLTCRGYPFTQLYVVDGKAIAIEPVTCIGNAFNHGVGLRVLPPGGIMEADYALELKKY